VTTKSTRAVTRESSAFVRDRGLRPIIVTITGSILELRAKGLRQREALDLAACYSIAVKQRLASEKAERAAARKAKAQGRVRPALRRVA
jgi:hypothetical protein